MEEKNMLFKLEKRSRRSKNGFVKEGFTTTTLQMSWISLALKGSLDVVGTEPVQWRDAPPPTLRSVV